MVNPRATPASSPEVGSVFCKNSEVSVLACIATLVPSSTVVAENFKSGFALIEATISYAVANPSAWKSPEIKTCSLKIPPTKIDSLSLGLMSNGADSVDVKVALAIEVCVPLVVS